MKRLFLVLAVTCLMFTSEASSELAGPQQASQVCRNWLTFIVEQEGHWAHSEAPQISRVEEVFFEDILLGYCFEIEPAGYVLVPTLMQLSPIKATSQSSTFDTWAEGGFSLLIREILHDRYQRYSNQHGEAALPLTTKNHKAWQRFLLDDNEFRSNLSPLNQKDSSRNGPLLTTAWHQGPPYNDFCPMGDGGDLCIVGCVATAIAQVMAYHGSPYAGEGHHQYYWTGDGTCGGVPRPDNLVADFNDPYEFDLMPDICTMDDPQRIRDAVAELCYEVGVSVNMNYGVCWSGSNTALAQIVLPQYFRYHDVARLAQRSDYDARQWFNLIQSDIDRSLPLLYSFALDGGGGHAVVCDGWRQGAGIDQIHLNYGWADSHTAWYALDDIYASVDPQQEKIVYNIQPGPDEVSGIVSERLPLQRLSLSASPNPFNPRTSIRFSLTERSTVSLRIFDSAGRLVAVLLEGVELAPGNHTVDWSGKNSAGRGVASGTYFLRVEDGLNVGFSQITLVR